MGWTTAALVALGLLFGRRLKPPKLPKPKMNLDSPDFEHASGFSSVSIDTTTPVPIVIGRTVTNGYIIKGYVLGDSNNRLLGALAIGEKTGDSDLLDFRLGEIQFEKLSTYSTAQQDNVSWYRYIDDASDRSLRVANLGKKPVYETLEDGEDYVSEYIQVFGDATISIEMQVYHNTGGTDYSFTVDYRTKGEQTWKNIEIGESTGRSDNIIDNKSYHGSKGILVPLTGLKSNTFQFRFKLLQATNRGSLHIKYIEVVRDTGGEVVITSPGCSYVLFNLIKTKEFNRLNFMAEVKFPYENPAIAIRFFLTNEEFGLGISEDLIDNDSFFEAQQYCQRENIEIGLSLQNVTYDVLIENILSCSLLSLTKVGGIFKLVTPEEKTSVRSINLENDIIPGSLSIGLQNSQETMNRLRVRYSDESKFFTRNDILMEDTVAIDYGKGLKEKTLDLSGLHNMETAQKIAERTYRRENRGQLWVKFSLDIAHSGLEPMQDVFTVNYSPLGWVAKEFQVSSISESLDNDNLFGVEVLAISYNSVDFRSRLNWNIWSDESSSLGKPFDGEVVASSELEVGITSVSSKIRVGEPININGNNYYTQYLRSYVKFGKIDASNITFYRLVGRNNGNYHSGYADWVILQDQIKNDSDEIVVDYLADGVRWELRMLYFYVNSLGETVQSELTRAPIYYFDTRSVSSYRYGGWRDYYYGILDNL